MTSPNHAGLPDNEGVGGWGGDGGPLSIIGRYGEQLVMWPFSRLLGWLLDDDPENFDTVAELFENVVPAIVRRVLGVLGLVIGGGSSDDLDPITAAELVAAIPFVGDVSKALRGITSGLSGGLLAGAENIEDLQDKTQALADVVGYRATYMPQGSGTYPVGSWKWLGFTATVGPAVGTTVTPEGMIVLGSRGLWRADTQVYFSWEAVLGAVEVEIVVFDEFGGVFGKRSFKANTGTGSTTHFTAICNYTFVTPRPGFGVRVQARTDGPGREILTGLQYTSFTVNKWSSETE